jgi:uncharacterized protein (TIGR00375 family)
MKYIADLHIHSKYSRGCSKKLDLENIALWCEYKGIDLVSCADFTFPAWNKEINKKFEETAYGIFKLKNTSFKTRFILGTELSCIYKKEDKCRKVHVCIFVPSLKALNKITSYLDKKCNIRSDGRPILGMDVIEIVKLVLDADPKSMIIPAHIWTPWFSVFGSKSGFDNLAQCFGEYTDYIYAAETGLSSDPEMNWRVSSLDHLTLVSNSDAHSLENLGREANVFELEELDYEQIYNAIKKGDKNVLKYTIEFYPQEGKYHLDGHAKCNISSDPFETQKYKGICPVCKKPLTVGVLNRVRVLADRKIGKRDVKDTIPFKSIVPLREIISQAFNKGVNTKAVSKEYFNLITKGGNEFSILLDLSMEKLQEITLNRIARGILYARKGNVLKIGGYDGVYGKIFVYPNDNETLMQKKLL